MKQTIDEKPAYARCYARGYMRGRNRMWTYVERIANIAKGYRARLQDRAAEQKCETCRRWERGCETCHWGYCAADFDYSTEPRMWVGRRDMQRTPEDTVIITSAAFSCTCWLPRGALYGDKDKGR